MTTPPSPMLATPYDEKLVTYPCYVQPKLDGVRALYHDGHFWTRNGEIWRDQIVEHILYDIRRIYQNNSIILDGEFYRHGWPLQRINGAIGVNRFEPCLDTKFIQYWIFDEVNYENPFVHRAHWKSFEPYYAENEHVVLTENVFWTLSKWFNNKVHADDYYEALVHWGYEGAIYRVGKCLYVSKRSKELLKRKKFYEEEFTVVGIKPGKVGNPLTRGRNADRVGSLICALSDGKSFSVGTGLSDEQRDLFWKNPELIIGGKVKVKFDTWSENHKPQRPRIVDFI